MHNYREGQIVLYRGSFGRGPIESVVLETATDTKNGSPVYDLDNGHWCYEDQIVGIDDSRPPQDRSNVLRLHR